MVFKEDMFFFTFDIFQKIWKNLGPLIGIQNFWLGLSLIVFVARPNYYVFDTFSFESFQNVAKWKKKNRQRRDFWEIL